MRLTQRNGSTGDRSESICRRYYDGRGRGPKGVRTYLEDAGVELVSDLAWFGDANIVNY